MTADLMIDERTPAAHEAASAAPPLVVDLDGTLIRTDMLHESALRVLGRNPLALLRMPGWLWQGKAVLKRELAQLTEFDPATLPYNEALLHWLAAQRAGGRRLVLCTASEQGVAQRIAEHLGLFDEVMASDGRVNLAGAAKAHALVQRFGRQGFDYAGNSSADLAVWRESRRAVVVDAGAGLARRAAACCAVERSFAAPAAGWRGWLRALRMHQWLKNLLLFMPLLAAHKLGDVGLWLSLTLAFVAFGLTASAVYITNDLLDLESDRQHLRKRRRAFASGEVPVWKGVLVAPLLLAAGMVLAARVNPGFLVCLVSYFLLTCAYTWGLKQLLLVDCLTLAMLYTLRIVAGAAAAGLELSFWLLAFSAFLCLSLAFIKRYAELSLQLQQGKGAVQGRAYLAADAPLVQTLGVTAGHAAVLVLAFYLNSEAVLALYQTPALVWGAVPVMMFWVSWMWMQAHRGLMHDDPLVFAIQDRTSLLAGGAFAAVLAFGALGWPW